MTSYSLYGTGSIEWVDGSVSTDDELAEEQLEAITNCLAAGAARALLDTTHDLADEDENESTEVYAEQWHSAAEGWELDAIHPDDRDEFLKFVGRFVRENIPYVILLAEHLAWRTPDLGGERPGWFHDQGMALYRVGQLLGYEGAGSGISLTDYDPSIPLDGEDYQARLRLADGGEPVERNGRRYRRTAGGRLALWVSEQETSAAHIWEDTWVDTTEEPCLLHLKA